MQICPREVLPFSRTHSAEWERRKQEVRHAHANGMAIDPNDCRRKGGGATRHLALQRDQRWGRASNPFDPTLQIAGRISSIILSCNVASKFNQSPTDAQEKLTSMEHKTSRVRLTEVTYSRALIADPSERQRSRSTDKNLLN